VRTELVLAVETEPLANENDNGGGADDDENGVEHAES
jgi:hypothetical protein